MADKSPASEGARSAPQERDEAEKRPPMTFRVLFKVLEVLGLILEVINGFKDLL